MTIIFSVVLIAALGACCLANIFFLERYYIQDKQKTLVTAYNYLEQAVQQNELETDDFAERLSAFCETGNIRLFVMGSDGQPKLATEKESQQLQRRLYAYLFFQTEEGKVLQKTDDYTIRMNVDAHMDGEYLEMTGSLSDGNLVLIRTSLAPIRENAMLANRFLLYVGLIVLVVGALIIRLMSRRIAEPILELASLSERISNLDFEAKFTGGRDDEVAFLGNHMNQLSEVLEKTISELKTANNELQRDIEQREKVDEMRTEFLSNVSHELKTPIALIQGYAEGLQECVNDDPESRSFYCEVIIDEAGKMNHMVRNLLALNELEFGNQSITMERFDLTGMLRNMLQSRRILFEQKEVRLVFDVRESVYVWADESKLEEVLNNYISNALNHVDGDKIIKITIEKQDGKVRTGVFNTGKPIPKEDLDRIWDKFYKVDKARTREYGGSGVGLSIVKAIMDSMHQPYGVINYDNGVEFWLELDDENVFSA
jgi:signal transduction histidine kinase